MLKQYRRFVTSSVGFSFLVVGITGVIFKLWFKNHVLEEIHGWLGLAMFVAAVLHIAQNWGPIKNYLRDLRVLALLIPIIVAIAFIVFGQKEEGRGPNPRQVVHRLAEGSLADVAKVFGKDLNAVVSDMKNDGLNVGDTSARLEDIAKANNKPPEGLLTYFLQ